VRVKLLSCSGGTSSKTDVFCLAGQLTWENLVAWLLAASGVRKIVESVNGKCKSHCVDMHTPQGHWTDVLVALERAPFLAEAHQTLKEEASVEENHRTVPRQSKRLKTPKIAERRRSKRLERIKPMHTNVRL
jgi:hypothetical protein